MPSRSTACMSAWRTRGSLSSRRGGPQEQVRRGPGRGRVVRELAALGQPLPLGHLERAEEDQVVVAGLQPGDPRGRLGDADERDLLDLSGVRVPVVVVGAGVGDAGPRLEVRHHVGPGAGRLGHLQVQVDARVVDHRRVDHDPRRGPQDRRQCGVRRAEVQPDGRVVDHVDRGDVLQVGAGVVRRLLRPVEARLDRIGVDRRAVVEGDVVPEVQRERQAVVGELPGLGQHGADLGGVRVSGRADIGQAVEHRVEVLGTADALGDDAMRIQRRRPDARRVRHAGRAVDLALQPSTLPRPSSESPPPQAARQQRGRHEPQSIVRSLRSQSCPSLPCSRDRS